MSNKCLRYFVDPQALREGVPVELLDRYGIEEINPDFKSQLKAMSWKKNERLYANPAKP